MRASCSPRALLRELEVVDTKWVVVPLDRPSAQIGQDQIGTTSELSVDILAEEYPSGLRQTLEPRGPIDTVSVNVAVGADGNVAQVHTEADLVWPVGP